MTAAMAFKGRDGRVRVVGFDVLLTDISAVTTSLRPGDHGEVVVLTDNNRVIGLPRNGRYRSIPDQLKALLKRPDELDTAHEGAIAALARIYEHQEAWPELDGVYQRELENASGDSAEAEIRARIARLAGR